LNEAYGRSTRGAWGAGTFENDDAGDFLSEVVEAPDGWALIRNTLDAVAAAAPGDEVEAPDASRALAAAEFVASARGKPSDPPEEEVVAWCGDQAPKDVAALAVPALVAVRRIRSSSELKDLWDESGDQEWAGVVADLEKRLS